MSKTLTTKCRKITLDMLLASTTLTKSSKETAESYLGRVTHLHLQGKKIKLIEGLELCTNLKVLYLYDNEIEFIGGLENQSILYYVYLQNNKIRDIGQLQMPALRKLYLDDNEIPIVSGLDVCNIMEVLSISRQRLPKFQSLKFDPISLRAIGTTLEVLEIAECGITVVSQFLVLRNLQRLIATNNQIADLNEAEAIMSLPKLEEVNFLGNPMCQLYKYRDVLVAAGPDCLILLDNADVMRHQQKATRGLVDMRRANGYMASFEPPKIEEVMDM